jgi:heme exporter protein A
MVKIENLYLSRGGRTILNNLSFRVQKSELLLLKGSNGSGKSSLLKAIAGFLPLAKGEIEKPLLHYLGHENGLKPSLTLRENLEFWQEYYEGEGGVGSALAQLNLTHLSNLQTRLLSQGQKRRLALAKLLVAHRQFWLLDEPQVGLDKASNILFEKLLETHLAKGGIVIMASHETFSLPHKILHLGEL